MNDMRRAGNRNETTAGGGSDAERLFELFKAQAPAEDVAAYDPAVLERAA